MPDLQHGLQLKKCFVDFVIVQDPACSTVQQMGVDFFLSILQTWSNWLKFPDYTGVAFLNEYVQEYETAWNINLSQMNTIVRKFQYSAAWAVSNYGNMCNSQQVALWLKHETATLATSNYMLFKWKEMISAIHAKQIFKCIFPSIC